MNDGLEELPVFNNLYDALQYIKNHKDDIHYIESYVGDKLLKKLEEKGLIDVRSRVIQVHGSDRIIRHYDSIRINPKGKQFLKEHKGEEKDRPESIYDRIDSAANNQSRVPKFPVTKVREFIRSLSFSSDIERYAKEKCDYICGQMFNKMPNHEIDGYLPCLESDTFMFTYSTSVLNPAKLYFQVADDEREDVGMLDNVIKECLTDMYTYTDYMYGDYHQLNMFNTELGMSQGVEYVKYSLSDIGEKVYPGIREKLLQNGIDCVYTVYGLENGQVLYFPWNEWNPRYLKSGGSLLPALYYRATDQLIEYARKKGYM